MLTAIQPYILDRYQMFRANLPFIDKLSVENSIGERERKLLIDSFEQSVDMKGVRKRIKDNLPESIKAKCPYCMISEYNTLDHYFDKSTYPEFTLFSKNLVPCCSQCNSYRGTRFRDTLGIRNTINFYYDVLPDKQFMFFDMIVDKSDPENIPTFEIRLELNNTQNEAIIRNHFQVLHLIDRYQNQIPDKISTTFNEAKAEYAKGLDVEQIISLLEIRIESLRKCNGINYWEACLYEGLIRENSTFIELLQSDNIV